ncbi:MAG: NADH dehydrogenase (quinone) subunit D [Deltaproteobacteria bacterium]|nr:NADH dehydrogenase (quinone) subunit D [Deltaproteobacteria bacterium]MBW2120346.1 NADH dehydrogenase (quinone) subunit D [Deltaproteobacteria bacterium]
MAEQKTMTINMGPQHPATHGVLRIVLELDGEIIRKATPVLGHLHRGIEKLAEAKTYHQCIPLTDRMDYVNAMGHNLGYVLAVEKLLGVEIPVRAQYVRVMLAELQRIASHLIWLGTHVLDLGATTPIMYCFREREAILRIFEEVAGGRITPTYFRIGGLPRDLPDGAVDLVRDFVKDFPRRIDDYEALLTQNVIFQRRTKGVGVLSAEDAINFSVTGPTLRGSGVSYDVRKATPYSRYEDFDFEVPVGEKGDVFDRYLVRMEEMRQSRRIVEQVVENLPEGPIKADAPQVVLPDKEDVETRIDALIRHFKIGFEGFQTPVGEVFQSVEASKGELGYYIVSDGGNKPFRLRVRAPSFANLSALPKMIEGQMIADVIATIGSIDIVLGEIDR